jgi:hypothetical protein
MQYWLDLFSGTTWKEFRAAGSTVTGFRKSQLALSKRVNKGDIFLCYLKGVMRWVGALEVTGRSKNTAEIWKDQDFPVRFEVKPIIQLDPEYGVPILDLEGRVSFFEGPQDRGKFKGLVRRSPARIPKKEDGDLILALLREAEAHPTSRPVDPRKLAQKPLYRAEQRRGKATVSTVVSVPEPDENGDGDASAESSTETTRATTRHTEIQYELARLGAELGLEVWIASNDRGKSWNGKMLGSIPRMVDQLPTQFNDATRRTIELIDVLWLKGNSYLAAFEVECTTSVYSGLLRMSDLLALQPNIDIKLYLVAPDERRAKVKDEILRPTFKLREKPLGEVCGFLCFSKLRNREKIT